MNLKEALNIIMATDPDFKGKLLTLVSPDWIDTITMAGDSAFGANNISELIIGNQQALFDLISPRLVEIIMASNSVFRADDI